MKPSEHKTVQSRILAYAQEIGWRYVSRAEAERRRGFLIQMAPCQRYGPPSVTVFSASGGIKTSCAPLKVAQ